MELDKQQDNSNTDFYMLIPHVIQVNELLQWNFKYGA